MRRVMIDTDVLIDVEKGRSSLPRAQLFISWVSLYEFLRGRRDFSEAKRRLEKVFTVLILNNEVVEKSVEIYRELKSNGLLIDDRDLLIGATAIVFDLPLLTKNKSHYERLLDFGLKLV